MTINSPEVLPARPKKQMLSISYELDAQGLKSRPVVRINYSSLELIQTCKRKARYVLRDELRSNQESPATLFGSGIHKGLEVWYSMPQTRRKPSCDGECASFAQLCANCAAIAAFRSSVHSMETLDPTDKRSPNSGERILRSYFSKFWDDPFEVMCDEAGLPLVEKTFEFVMVDEPHVKIIYFGTVDAILRNTQTGVVLVVDHKTTSSLGSEFYNRIKPNHQYTGYIMGAQKVLGIQTELFLVNGLQVAKTKADCARQITTRTEEDQKELVDAVRFAVSDYLLCEAQDRWPMNAPNPCTNFGGCQYRVICEAPEVIRGQIIQNLYNNEGGQ